MEQHIGTDFDKFLAEEQWLEEVTAEALKRVEAWEKCQLAAESSASTEAD